MEDALVRAVVGPGGGAPVAAPGGGRPGEGGADGIAPGQTELGTEAAGARHALEVLIAQALKMVSIKNHLWLHRIFRTNLAAKNIITQGNETKSDKFHK